MNIQTNTIPSALTNSASYEIQNLREYIKTEGALETFYKIENNLELINESFGHGFDIKEDNADAILTYLDDVIDAAKDLALNFSCLKEGYLDNLGIQEEISRIAQELLTSKTKDKAKALCRGLELMWHSERKLPKNLHEIFIALGMPDTNKGRAVDTYRLAYMDSLDSWEVKILNDICNDNTANRLHEVVEFIDGGPFTNQEPEFIDMTPEDVDYIQGAA